MLFGMIGMASSQDFSWGLNASLGQSRNFTGINTISSYDYMFGQSYLGQTDSGSVKNMKAKNFSIGLNAQYRIAKKWSLGIEVNYYKFVLSDNSLSMNFLANYWSGYNYATAYFESSVTKICVQPIVLLDFNVTDDFHLYGGFGLDIWSNKNQKFELKSMERYGADNFDTPTYTDEQELSMLQSYSYYNSISNRYSNFSAIYGFYYQMNNFKIGYRNFGAGVGKGIHQLTLGYDIGRYQYQ